MRFFTGRNALNSEFILASSERSILNGFLECKWALILEANRRAQKMVAEQWNHIPSGLLK